MAEPMRCELCDKVVEIDEMHELEYQCEETGIWIEHDVCEECYDACQQLEYA